MGQAHGVVAHTVKLLFIGRLAGLLHRRCAARRPGVPAPVAATVPARVTAGDREVAEKPWRSCVCPIESDARDGLGLMNVCAILH
jgi:hypothetical protein